MATDTIQLRRCEVDPRLWDRTHAIVAHGDIQNLHASKARAEQHLTDFSHTHNRIGASIREIAWED